MTLKNGTSRVKAWGHAKRTPHRAPKCGRVLAAALIATGFLVGTAKADVLYVAAEALPGGDGQTWSTAHRFLQDALAAAAPGSGVTEIRVAQGVYTPDRSEAAPEGTGDRNATFTLINGVALRGGFAGPGFGDPDERDWEVYETILSGDLAGDDGPDFENYSENSYTIVTATAVNATAILEGFTLKGGNATGTSTGPTSLHRMFGGAIFSQSGSPTVAHSVFLANRATAGGAVAFRDGAQPLLQQCNFTGNRSGMGGAVHIWNDSAAVIDHCNFVLNSSDGAGGAIRTRKSDVTVRDSKFKHNEAAGTGAAIWFENGSVVVEGCSFLGNVAGGPGAAIHTGTSGGNPDKGACFFISDSTFIGNHSAIAGGAAYLVTSCGTSTVVRSTFKGSSTTYVGGAIVADAPVGTAIRFLDCVITESSITGSFGSGMALVGDITLTNCLITKNYSATGATPAIAYGAKPEYMIGPQITNCTIADNVGSGVARLEEQIQAPIVIHNSIIWGNTGGQIMPNPLSLVFNSNIQGGWNGAGSDNIDADPLFVQAGMGNYRLSEGSPCIDVGENSVIPADVSTDLAGNPRIVNGIVDMGAYEGEFDPMPAATMASNIGPGEAAFLTLTTSDGSGDIKLIFVNLSDETAEHVTVTQHEESVSPEAVGYSTMTHSVELSTTLEDGQFHANIAIPFTAAQLGEHALEEVSIALLDPGYSKWNLAVSNNLSGQVAQHPTIQVGSTFTSLNLMMGTYGVFWNPTLESGLSWANVDRTGHFVAGVNTCPADLTGTALVDIIDLLILLGAWGTSDPLADLNNDGIVNMDDLVLLIAAWGPCP